MSPGPLKLSFLLKRKEATSSLKRTAIAYFPAGLRPSVLREKKKSTKLHFITGADFIVLDKEAADLSGLRMCSSAVLSVPADVLPLEDGQKQERMLQKAVQPSSRFLLQPTPTGLSSGELQ